MSCPRCAVNRTHATYQVDIGEKVGDGRTTAYVTWDGRDYRLVTEHPDADGRDDVVASVVIAACPWCGRRFDERESGKTGGLEEE